MADVDRTVEALALVQHGAFGRAQAVEAGFSHDMIRYRLETGAWGHSRFDDVYRLSGAPVTWRQELWAGSLWGGPQALVAGRSAAALYEIDRCPEGPLELLLPLHAKHKAPRGVRVRRSDHPVRAREIDGLRVADPETTLLSVARAVRLDVLDDVVESTIELGLTTPGRVLDAIGCRPGSGPIRRLLLGRAPGRPRQRRLEGELARLVSGAGIRLVRQHEVQVGDDRFFLDFAVPELRVAVELDGFEKLRTKSGKQHFLWRETRLQLARWRVLHFSWDDVTLRPDEVLADLAAARIG